MPSTKCGRSSLGADLIKKIYNRFCKTQKDVPHIERKERAMNVREKSLKTILEKNGFNKYLLIAQAEGSRIRLPPKSRYEQPPPLRPAPSFLVLVHSELDDLIKGLDQKALQKIGSLTRYILKQITSRVKKEKKNDGQK